ncbi:MAG: PAS domain S-box protein [Myxococcales bacterium FL481]|nr:MAG: PAS domain S-box protein [Myxococcales bacterium FL481]
MSEARVRQASPFRFISETVPDAIIFADHAGLVTYCNAAACEMFGHADEAVLGRPLTILMPDRYRKAHNAGLARFVATGRPRMMGQIVELTGERADGSEFPIEISFSANGEGTDIMLVAFIRDITERKRVQAELVRRAEQISALKDALERERDYLREEVKAAGAFGEIVGDSPALRATMEQVDAVARTDATVLITGESGVGKELIARALHERSPRADHALVKVNCATVPKELFESEFFGHVKGAFTGAAKTREGRFQLAHEGTIFLDEVGEIPLELQSKLLRVLQEQEFERVGDDRTRRVDVRVVAATNRDLAEEVAQGRFRQDLYYRLNVFPVSVPPLRERSADIPALARHLLQRASTRLKVPAPALEPVHVERLCAYDWPGNIRELQNVMERAAILSRGGALRLDGALPTPPTAEATSAPSASQLDGDAIEAALADAGGNVSRAAQRLGVTRQSLYRRMAKLGLSGASTNAPSSG